MNTQQPGFADLAAGDVRPTGSLAGARSAAVPEFAWSDLPSRPQAPAGTSAT